MATALIVEAEETIDSSLMATGDNYIDKRSGEEKHFICEDAVKKILAQPKEEMSIVKLLNSDPMIRELLLRKPEPEAISRSTSIDYQSQDSIIEEDESAFEDHSGDKKDILVGGDEDGV